MKKKIASAKLALAKKTIVALDGGINVMGGATEASRCLKCATKGNPLSNCAGCPTLPCVGITDVTQCSVCCNG